MRELCHDPQTELAFLRESLGVRVLGHTILHLEEAAKNFDEVGQR